MLPKILSSPVVLADRVELGEGVSVNVAASRDLFYSSVSNTDEALKACVYAVRYFSSEPYPTPLEMPPGWNLKRISLRKLKIEGDVCIEPRVYILEYDSTHDICILGLEIPGAKGHSDEAHQQFLNHLFIQKQDVLLSLAPSVPSSLISQPQMQAVESLLESLVSPSQHPLSLTDITTTSLSTEAGFQFFNSRMAAWVEAFLKPHRDISMICERDGYYLTLSKDRDVLITHKPSVLDKLLGCILNYYDNPATPGADKKKLANLLLNSLELAGSLLAGRPDILPAIPFSAQAREISTSSQPSISGGKKKKKNRLPSDIRAILDRGRNGSFTNPGIFYYGSNMASYLYTVLHGKMPHLKDFVHLIKSNRNEETSLWDIRLLFFMAIIHQSPTSKEVNTELQNKMRYLATQVGDINFTWEHGGCFLNPIQVAIESGNLRAAALIKWFPGFNVNHKFRLMDGSMSSPLLLSIAKNLFHFVDLFLTIPQCEVNQNGAAKLLFDSALDKYLDLITLEELCLHPRFDSTFLSDVARYKTKVFALLERAVRAGKPQLVKFCVGLPIFDDSSDAKEVLNKMMYIVACCPTLPIEMLEYFLSKGAWEDAVSVFLYQYRTLNDLKIFEAALKKYPNQRGGESGSEYDKEKIYPYTTLYLNSPENIADIEAYLLENDPTIKDILEQEKAKAIAQWGTRVSTHPPHSSCTE
jgi:hypothetical protein